MVSELNKRIAYFIAKELPKFRVQHDTDKGSGYNLADAFYYITDVTGALTGQMGFLGDEPAMGRERDGGHSEPKLMLEMESLVDFLLAEQLKLGEEICPLGGRVHVVLFTQKESCLVCQLNMRLAVAVANDRLIDVGMNLSLSVWNAKDQTKPGMFTGNVKEVGDVTELMYLDENTPAPPI